MNETFLNVSDEFHSQMEKDQSQFIEFITEGVLLIIISIFGFVGNALSIYVLLRPTVKGIFSNILMGLASFDALFLICAIVTFGLPTGQLGCGVYKWKLGKLKENAMIFNVFSGTICHKIRYYLRNFNFHWSESKPSLKIGTANAIFWIFLGIFRDHGQKNTFFRDEAFLFSR